MDNIQIKRTIQHFIEQQLFKGKIIVVYGARQVGKTTLVRAIQKKQTVKTVCLNCDEPDIRLALTDKTSTELKLFFGDNKLVIMDESQRVKNIGLTLKLIADNFPEIQIIATGSSSFDLSNKIVEPLTGRKIEFYLYPFSLGELRDIYSDIEINRILETMMIFGMYPEIALSGGDLGDKLKALARSYAYKDVLQYQNIKNPEILEKLLQALALQVGNEVSYNELSSFVGADKITVASYIQILEKAFVIFRIGPFSRNLRNELKKTRKIYFYDNGIRNALINNLNPLNLRQDAGALWENFMISERIKLNNNFQKDANLYFWRTLQKQEIDLIEDNQGKIAGFEFKRGKKFGKVPLAFSRAYPEAKVQTVNPDNYRQFLDL
jgi:predicted AAA+ superfamily ATPase